MGWCTLIGAETNSKPVQSRYCAERSHSRVICEVCNEYVLLLKGWLVLVGACCCHAALSQPTLLCFVPAAAAAGFGVPDCHPVPVRPDNLAVQVE